MKSERRERYYNRTVTECIEQFVGELPSDAVGLWQILPMAREGFGFEGVEQIDFIRTAIKALLEAGAIPVRYGGRTHDWVQQHQYGKSIDEIAQSVIEEWASYGDMKFDEIKVYGEAVWFARPRADPRYIRE
ncbi:MAG TPA: hypothetical protein PK264_21410 [Hyphomicrobiaceae bacterium]|nr:hypothetical protein [Hyphomicrobiaceae bacterium]